MSGKLYLVSTPIGNLGDVSRRALDTLNTVDFIAAEDTRVTGKLLGLIGVKKPMVSYYEHNRYSSGEKILARILSGESCALVTDAGTPAVSDPGEDLVSLCAENGVEITAIPGPCAAAVALSLSGLSARRFTFEGFLSTAAKSRREHLESLREERRVMIFYEAPHKLQKTLDDMQKIFGDRRLCVCRELTKLHEEILRTTFSEAIRHFAEAPPRGEFVLVIDGAPIADEPSMSSSDAIALTREYIADGLSRRDAAKKAAFISGFGKNQLYDWSINHEPVKNN